MQDQYPTKPDKTRQILKIRPRLNVEQEHAIDLLIQGNSDRVVAEAVKVSRQTVCGWRNHNPAFVAELDRRQQDLLASHVDRLRQLAGKAIAALEQDLMEGHMHLGEVERRLR